MKPRKLRTTIRISKDIGLVFTFGRFKIKETQNFNKFGSEVCF